jgi:hypothetical protein
MPLPWKQREAAIVRPGNRSAAHHREWDGESQQREDALHRQTSLTDKDDADRNL